MVIPLLGIGIAALGCFGISMLIWAGKIETRVGILEDRLKRATLAVEAQLLKENRDE